MFTVAVLVSVIFAPLGVAIIRRDVRSTVAEAVLAYAVMAVIALYIAWF